MLPEMGEPPQYAQLYIFDTNNEVENKLYFFRDNKKLEKDMVTSLKQMLDENNVQAKAFRMERDILKETTFHDLKLKLITSRPGDDHVYNTPTVSEVVAQIVGDIDSAELRDIIIH
ncbi:unnamed protein product [Lathyrus sativus]|nr:unnamed protein product [Lathyrus sativus]